MNKVLNYEGFESNFIRKIDKRNGSVYYIFRFDNGYGASVGKFYGSYGRWDDLWELAVIKFEPGVIAWETTYDTPITDSTVGYLDDMGVKTLLKQISEL